MQNRSQVIDGQKLPGKVIRRRKAIVRLSVAAAGAATASLVGARALQAANTPDFYTGAATGDFSGTAGNWNLGTTFSGNNTVPSGVTYDAVFPFGAAAGIRTMNSTSLTLGSLDVLATSNAAGIQDDSTGATNTTLTLGGSGDLGNSVTSGQPNDLIYVTSGSTLNLYGKNAGGGTGTLGIVLGQSGNFDSAGTIDIGAVISDGGNGYGFAQAGGGTIVLSAANTFTGATTLGAGMLELNFNDTTYAATVPTTNIISSSSALVFSGSSILNLTGKSTANDAQTFNGTTLNGFGNVTLTGGAAAEGVALNLGAITRNVGGGINITQPTVDTTLGAANGAFTTTGNNAAGILGGWATVGNTDFAAITTSVTNQIVAFGGTGTGSYATVAATGANAPTTVYSDTLGAASLSGNVTVDGLKILTNAGTLTLGSFNLTVNGANGGILTDVATTIATGGSGILSAGSGNELILGGNSTLTITGSNLIGSNSGSLTKIDTNTIIITAANSYAGGTYLAAGTLDVQNNSALGTGPITFSGGTINSNGAGSNTTLANNLITIANTVSTMTPLSNNFTLSGALTGSGDLTMNAGGAVTGVLSGDLSQFTGTLTVNTTNGDSNQSVGGASGASLNLGQATLVLTGGNGSNRRLGWGGTLQVGALQAAVGAGTVIGGSSGSGTTLQVGALGTNTAFAGNLPTGSFLIVTKVGTGSLSLNGNSFWGTSGDVTLDANGGTLAIDESNLTTPTGLLGGPLGVGGGTFALLEKAGTATSQGFTGTTINAGNSTITANQNGGSSGVLLQLGGFTRNPGGTVNFINPSGTPGSTNGITTTQANGSGGILGYATVGGVAYAVSGASATVPISALGTYAQTWSSGNVSDTTATHNDTETGSVTVNATSTINSLTISDTGNDTLTLSNNLTFSGTNGGLLYAGNGSGGGSYIVNGPGILGAGTANEFILNINSGATLTVNSPIIGSGAGFLTTAGGGNLVLTAGSAYTGTATAGVAANLLNAGTVTISADNDLGAGNATSGQLVNMNGVTLTLASGYASTLFSTQGNTKNGITLGNNGGTINTNGNSVSYGGVITGGTVNSTSANTAGGFSFTKAGLGTLTLTSNSTYGGATIITGGVLSVNNLNATETANGGVTSSIGEGPNTAPYLVLNGGTLQYIGTSAATTDRQFTLGTSGGAIDSSSPTADTLTWSGNTGSGGTAVNAVAEPGSGTRTLTLTGSNTGANTFAMILGDSSAGATSLTKSGVGQWGLSAANTYSGATTINGGTLNVTGSLASGSAVTIGGSSASGTPTLTGTGTVGGTVNLASAGGGAAGKISPGTVGGVGTLTTGAETWNGGIYQWDIGSAGTLSSGIYGTPGTTYDDLVATAGLTVPTAGAVTIAPTGTLGSIAGGTTYTWVLAQINTLSVGGVSVPAGSTPISSDFALSTSGLTASINGGATATAAGTFALYFEAETVGGSTDDLVLSYTSAPEPGTAMLVLGGMLPVLMGRRRRQLRCGK